LAASIVEPVRAFIGAHSTLSVERSVLRLLGVDGVGTGDVPVPNLILDALDERARGGGIAVPFGKALAQTGLTPADPGAALASGKPSPAGFDDAPVQAARAIVEKYARESIKRIAARRDERRALLQQLPQHPSPLLYVIVASGHIYEDRTAAVAAAQAAVSIALQNLTNTRIASPIDGYVGEKHVEVGQTVSAGMPLLTLIPNGVFITANYKETQVGDMHPGQPVDLHVDAYKGVTFHGRVIAINPASQNTYALVPSQNSTGNFVKVTQRIPVKISIDDADPQKYPMRPGMSVEAAVAVH